MAISPLAYKKNTHYLAYTMICLIIAQSWGVHHFFEFTIQFTSIDSAISVLSLGALMYLISNTLSYYHPKRGKTIITIISASIIALAWVKLTGLVISFFIDDSFYSIFLSETEFYRFTVSFLLFAGTFIISLIWYQLDEKEELNRRKEETDKMAKQAELFKLRHQLQPHFLFNSLNSINSLIGTKPEIARKMVLQLSDFLRGTVKREDQKLVNVEQEIEYLKLYLDIEQVRFGHRLKVNLNQLEDVSNFKLPSLILQPILENAIKFGLYGTTGEVEINIDFSIIHNNLHVHIQNPFDKDMQTKTGTGFGLKSVQRRLQLIYGSLDLLQVSQEESIFNVYLKIPISND